MKFSSENCSKLLHIQPAIGGSTSTEWAGIAIDGRGNSWVCGNTNAATYFTATNHGGGDALVIKLSPSGTQLSVDLVGGLKGEEFYAVTVDSNNNAYFVGYSISPSVDDQTRAGDYYCSLYSYYFDF